MSVIRTLRKTRGPRRAGLGRSERGHFLLLLAAAGLLAWTPPPTSGQNAPPPTVSQLRDQMDVAREAYEAALAVANLDRNELVEVMNEISRTRASDESAWAEALTRHFAAAEKADRSEARAERRKQALDSVKALLADRLAARRDSLQVVLVGLPPDEGDDVRARIRDLSFEIEELRPPPREPSLAFAFRAPVAYDRRDGPDQIRGKIQIAERLLGQQDSLIAYWDSEIKQVEERISAEQRLGDFQDAIGRFGDSRPPTGSNPAREDDEPANLPADSAAVQQQPLTPEELLERYRSILNNTRRYREAIAENLTELRVVLGRIGAR